MKKFTRGVLIAILTFALSMTYNKIHYRYDLSNAFWRTAMSLFSGTIYSKEYTEENFQKVTMGMQRTEVIKLLGEPLRIDTSPISEGFIYSNQDTPTADYDRRWIAFDENKKVKRIVHDFYID